MLKLYNIITGSDKTLEKEITVPSGNYCINNTGTIEYDHNLVYLDLSVTDLSLRYIEVALQANYYTVTCITKDNKSITQMVNYNSPFLYKDKLILAIKEHSDVWSESIFPENEKKTTPCYRYRNWLFLFLVTVFFIISATVLIIKDSNKIKGMDKEYARGVIKKYISNSDYMIHGNSILIFSSDKNIIAGVKNDLPDYNIHIIDKTKLKKRKSDIILTPDFNNRKEIIYIQKNNDTINTNSVSLPDKFRREITIKTLSFSDITRLINNHLEGKITCYSVKKLNNTILIYADKRRDKETDDIIKNINTAVFLKPGNTLVQYRENTPRKTPPGVYGSLNYIYLSDNHTKFTSDNE